MVVAVRIYALDTENPVSRALFGLNGKSSQFCRILLMFGEDFVGCCVGIKPCYISNDRRGFSKDLLNSNWIQMGRIC